jgi:transcriptional regulator with XRE-family HTH domain
MTATVFAWDTDVVPRRPPHDQGPDEWAAWRVHHERERLDLSQGELARQVTAAGAPMQQQAIWKIENGTPPRKISYGEAIALCKVFGIKDIAELGRPPEEVVSGYVHEIKFLLRNWRDDTDLLLDQLRHIREHSAADPETWRDALKDLRYWIAEIEKETARAKAHLEDGPDS